MRLGYHLRIAASLSLMRIKTQMEYRVAFFLDRIAQFVAYSASFSALWVLLERFGSLGGWAWDELALLLSFHLLNYALGASVSFVQMRDLENLIARGEFDSIMVKPVSPWLYVVFEGFNIVGYSGHIVLAAVLMIWSMVQLPTSFDFWAILFLLASLASATLIVAALVTIIGATALHAVRARYLYPIFFGFWELMRYPLNIFPTTIVFTLLTIIPMGYLSFVPVAVILGKEVPILGVWAAPISLMVGPVLVVLTRLYWRRSILRYQGAGG